jgi:hypothetical protein
VLPPRTLLTYKYLIVILPAKISRAVCFTCAGPLGYATLFRVKALTRKQLEGRKQRAAQFVRDVLDDPGRADEIENLSLEDYAERRKIKIADENPRGADAMQTKEELMQRIKELEEENDDMQDQLDQVGDIVAPPDEDEEEGDNGGDEDNDAGNN